MTQLNRYASRSNFNNKQSVSRRWTSNFKRQSGLIIAVLDHGYLPQGHNDLPKPFCSFKVETNTGKRYIVRLEGRQALEFTGEVGQLMYYEGVFKGRFVDKTGKYHGEYWSATFAEIDNKEIDEYVAHLTAVKMRMDKESQDAADNKQ